MHACAVLISAFMATVILASAAAEPAGKTVKLDAGVIQGAVSSDVLSFKGIPYAKP